MKLVIIAIYTTLSFLLNNMGWIGIVMWIGSIAYIMLMDLKNVIQFKLLIISTMIIWLIHDFMARSYVAFAFDIGTIVANVIAIIRILIQNQKGALCVQKNEIEKIEKNLKRKYGKLPQRRPHFFRQFYEVSLYSDFVLLSVVIILYIAENLVNSTPYSILKNLAMTITLIVIWIQCIILNLYERYKAQDIY